MLPGTCNNLLRNSEPRLSFRSSQINKFWEQNKEKQEEIQESFPYGHLPK